MSQPFPVFTSDVFAYGIGNQRIVLIPILVLKWKEDHGSSYFMEALSFSKRIRSHLKLEHFTCGTLAALHVKWSTCTDRRP